MNIEEIKKQYPEWEKPFRKNTVDLTDQKLGRLQILYRYYQNTPQGNAQWVCQCECGNIKVIRGGSLTKSVKPTRSCGCQTYENASKANKKDLKNHRVVWHCKCDCGKEVDRISDSLVQGDTLSCGHCNRSIGSIKIEQLLKENNIQYEMEKTFPDLKGKNDMPFRFDFYLPEYNRLIEFDGIQHYKERDIFSDSLKTVQERDSIKNQYCINNNIPLVRIPYWRLEKLTLKDLLDAKYEVEL